MDCRHMRPSKKNPVYHKFPDRTISSTSTTRLDKNPLRIDQGQAE
jgi:hypothetical protein